MCWSSINQTTESDVKSNCSWRHFQWCGQDLAWTTDKFLVVTHNFLFDFSGSKIRNAASRVVSGTRKFDRGLSSINSESQFTSVCRTRLLSSWWTAARVHPTFQVVNALDRPTVTSWWFHDTVKAHLVVGLSPLRVRWNGTRFQTLSGTLSGVPIVSDRLWKLISSQRQGMSSALEALQAALYKYMTITTTTTATYDHCN